MQPARASLTPESALVSVSQKPVYHDHDRDTRWPPAAMTASLESLNSTSCAVVQAITQQGLLFGECLLAQLLRFAHVAACLARPSV